MGLLADQLDLVDGATWSASDFNTLKDAVHTVLGDTSLGTGTVDDANIKTGAQIAAAKILYTAMTLGSATVQTMTTPTTMSGLGPFLTTGGTAGFGFDTAAGNIYAPAISGSTQAMAIQANKSFYAPTAASDADIKTITGGTQDQTIWIYLGTNTHLTLTHTTTSLADSVHLQNGATTTSSVASTVVGKVLKLQFKTDLLSSTGQWFQIG